jgi:hypothetical protein
LFFSEDTPKDGFTHFQVRLEIDNWYGTLQP